MEGVIPKIKRKQANSRNTIPKNPYTIRAIVDTENEVSISFWKFSIWIMKVNMYLIFRKWIITTVASVMMPAACVVMVYLFLSLTMGWPGCSWWALVWAGLESGEQWNNFARQSQINWWRLEWCRTAGPPIHSPTHTSTHITPLRS